MKVVAKQKVKCDSIRAIVAADEAVAKVRYIYIIKLKKLQKIKIIIFLYKDKSRRNGNFGS